MRINLLLTFADGTTKDITCNASDLVAFEDKFNVSSAKLGGGDSKLSWLLYLAWHSEKRTGSTKDNFEKWLDTIEGVGGSDKDPK
jgi:hypothetical protein